ncbi:MAG: carboxypeptidase-like regulatory domain-containing protein, partial [Bacteroidetes bacterium]|nr:carboxypeptidase-like regulatory domain-containing protein [Bacteroidota bacterium]
MNNFYLILLVCSVNIFCFAQNTVSGVITDEHNIPIPSAKVFIKNLAEQRTISDLSGNYELSLLPGEYFLVFSAFGYDDRESYISITSSNITRNIQLFPSKFKELDNIDVITKKTNPGRDIILEVVKKRDQINPWNFPHSVSVYIKAVEKLEDKVKSKKSDDDQKSKNHDPLDEKNDKFFQLSNKMNLAEIKLTRHYASIEKVKEYRTAYTLRGNAKNLYYTTTVKSNFNFFENLLYLNDLHQTPIISPISTQGILSYKYRLEKKIEEHGQIISKIKIIPRNISTSTLEGYIWVIDSLWLIQKIELRMNKGNLLVYDYFSIEQNFIHPGDSICILTEQNLSYGVKYKNETSKSYTKAIFSDYNFSPQFSNKFFNSELAFTDKEAYEKDTLFWTSSRQVDLTAEERDFILLKDSIRDAHNRKEYLDSIDRIFNKISFLKVVWYGIDYRNRAERYQLGFSPLSLFIQPVSIGGPRLSPSFDYFKKWKNERTLESYTRVSYGFLNKDLKGDTWWKYKFNPFHFGFIRFSLTHDFDAIRYADAINQIYKRNNFIEATKISSSIEYELFNGFYGGLGLGFAERRSLKDFKFLNTFDDILPNDNPSDFKNYQALIASVSLSYTPGQKYMREPYRKVVLGSRWPSFSLNYERGLPKIFGSDVDHEYLQMDVKQTFKIGTLGTTSYRISTGKFLSARNLYNPDM